MLRTLQHAEAGAAFRDLLEGRLDDPVWDFDRLTSLLLAILRNVSYEMYRRRQRVSPGGRNGNAAPDAIDRSASPEVLLLEKEWTAELAGLVQQLSDGQREVVELRVLGDLEYKEIASKLGRNKSTVGVQLRRGFERLAELLSGKEKADG